MSYRLKETPRRSANRIPRCLSQFYYSMSQLPYSLSSSESLILGSCLSQSMKYSCAL